MFKRILGYQTLLVVVIFAGSWGVALWSWRDHYRLPTAQEIVTHFLMIPTALCLGYWGLYQSVEWLKRRRSGVTEALAGTGPSSNTKPALPLQIRDWSIQLPVGDEPATVFEALKARERPALHPTLKDANGFPRRIAWVDTLSTEDFIESGQAHPLPIDVRRALLLALEVLEPLLMRHVEREFLDTLEPQAPLPVHFIVPARWSTDTQAAARQWLVSALAPFSESGLECAVLVSSAADTRQVLSFLEQLRRAETLEADNAQQVVVAADSFIQDQTYAGPLPEASGEGACALLIAQGLLPAASTPQAVIVHPFDSEQRTQSVDLPGQARSPALQQLLQPYSAGPTRIGAVFIDAAPHTSRQTELLAAVHATLPDLDPISECLSLPMCCGEMGPVTSLVSLALAASNSLETQQDCLLVSMYDPLWRAVCHIQPSPPPAQKPLQDFA
ncbi:hypothetical protein [Pseudomonas sp.]|uniref:hypothetical protein n=1 Tax=Pseudomonas sp. TaxID=306 RepID=UPI002621A3DF|nr:hypothetical protein [Pseudomonas sp.]